MKRKIKATAVDGKETKKQKTNNKKNLKENQFDIFSNNDIILQIIAFIIPKQIEENHKKFINMLLKVNKYFRSSVLKYISCLYFIKNNKVYTLNLNDGYLKHFIFYSQAITQIKNIQNVTDIGFMKSPDISELRSFLEKNNKKKVVFHINNNIYDSMKKYEFEYAFMDSMYLLYDITRHENDEFIYIKIYFESMYSDKTLVYKNNILETQDYNDKIDCSYSLSRIVAFNKKYYSFINNAYLENDKHQKHIYFYYKYVDFEYDFKIKIK